MKSFKSLYLILCCLISSGNIAFAVEDEPSKLVVIEKQQITQFIYTLQDSIFYDVRSENIYLTNSEICALAKGDAKFYHDKKWKHSILGFATLGASALVVAAWKPKAEKGKFTPSLSENQALFANETYQKCYAKKARGQNLTATLKGAGVWMIVIILFS